MTSYGIEKLNIYAGQVVIDAAQIADGRGLDPERLTNIQQAQRSVGLGCEDPVSNAVNAAKPIVEAIGDAAERIELVLVSTESGVDYSKSLASYVHKHLGLSTRCRFLEVKQACYAATGALQLALGYLAGGASPGAKALLIATDVALVDERAGFSELSTGFGAVALLLGDQPDVLRMDRGAFGLHSYETPDSARPTPTKDIADIDRSLFAYLDCLSQSFAHYQQRVDDADFAQSFGLLAMHTPFPGLVRAGHRKMMRDGSRKFDAGAIEEDFRRRVAPSLVYPATIGNLCSGSLYLALASAIESHPSAGEIRVGLFAYGSGCSSEFFSGVIGPRSRQALRPFELGRHLANRTRVDFAVYSDLLRSNLQILVPVENRRVDLAAFTPYLSAHRGRLLVLEGVSGYYRNYIWI